jgi:alcohol dehydrogenase class IV
MIDVRAGWACGNTALELTHGLGVALGLDFDTTVGRVPHPSADAVLRSDSLREVTKSDALDATAEQISSGNSHRRQADLNEVVLLCPRCPLR